MAKSAETVSAVHVSHESSFYPMKARVPAPPPPPVEQVGGPRRSSLRSTFMPLTAPASSMTSVAPTPEPLQPTDVGSVIPFPLSVPPPVGGGGAAYTTSMAPHNMHAQHVAAVAAAAAHVQQQQQQQQQNSRKRRMRSGQRDHVELSRKMRKNDREKQRRSELNQKFSQLERVLTIRSGGKLEKSAVLSQAIAELDVLRRDNAALKQKIADLKVGGGHTLGRDMSQCCDACRSCPCNTAPSSISLPSHPPRDADDPYGGHHSQQATPTSMGSSSSGGSGSGSHLVGGRRASHSSQSSIASSVGPSDSLTAMQDDDDRHYGGARSPMYEHEADRRLPARQRLPSHRHHHHRGSGRRSPHPHDLSNPEDSSTHSFRAFERSSVSAMASATASLLSAASALESRTRKRMRERAATSSTDNMPGQHEGVAAAHSPTSASSRPTTPVKDEDEEDCDHHNADANSTEEEEGDTVSATKRQRTDLPSTGSTPIKSESESPARGLRIADVPGRTFNPRVLQMPAHDDEGNDASSTAACDDNDSASAGGSSPGPASMSKLTAMSTIVAAASSGEEEPAMTTSHDGSSLLAPPTASSTTSAADEGEDGGYYSSGESVSSMAD